MGNQTNPNDTCADPDATNYGSEGTCTYSSGEGEGNGGGDDKSKKDKGECLPGDKDCIYAITLSTDELTEIYEMYDQFEELFYILAAGVGIMALLSFADPPVAIVLGLIAAYAAWEGFASGELADFFYSAVGEATQNGGSTTITLSSGFALSTTGNPAPYETLFSASQYQLLDLLKSYAP